MDSVMGKKKKGRQKEAPMKEERKKQGYLVPVSALTPNTLVSDRKSTRLNSSH